MNDRDIETLLQEAAEAEPRAETRAVPQALMARVLADAERLQPAPQRPAPAARPASAPLLTQILDAIGGWIGPAAVAASLCIGLGVGLSDPASLGLPDIASYLSQSPDAADGLDALSLGEFDLTAAEW